MSRDCQIKKRIGSMDNIETYYQACLDQYTGQEAARREFTLKALGILTFCTTVFGVAVSSVEGTLSGIALLFLLVIAAALTLAIALGLCILIPRSWREQFDISRVRKLVDKNKEHNEFVLKMADECKEAINYNRPKLDKSARKIQWLIVAAAIEVVAFICFHGYFLYFRACQIVQV